MAEKEILNDQLHWYKDAIIYELHIKAFKDSNGDGIGDFSGLLEKLDYLQELGVTAIWVLPFYPSPLKDDGYDIADYYSINPSYGNIEQFKEFLQEAHKRNLKVITELVINHTSDQHPWFQRARSAPKGSPERDYYVWSDDPNQWKDVRIIFTDYEASNWTWDPVAQQYYWHRFFHHQPDLNYDSPLVQEEIFKILDYWCAMGVDGFRLDAVPYLFEREGTNGENLPETHAFLKKLRKHIDEYFPGTVFLAEANMWPEDSASYFGNGDECHMNYHFPVMPRMFMALQREDRYPITDIFDQTPEIPETCQWAMFLRNHDELTLEMVTDEERDYMYKVYAKDPKAKINLGIRHRLAPLMDNNRRKIELMNSLLFSLPGTPVIYYGDEIGMGDNFYLGDRDGVRTPMQWSPDRNAGFSAANPHKLYLPVILDPEYNYESVNVEMQRSNTSSLFWYMKRIINMRKRFKAFSRGDMKFINVDNPKVLAFTRSYGNETILVIVNLSKYSQPSEIPLKEFKGLVPVEVFSKNRFPLIKDDAPYFFTLAPYDFQWFQLEKAHPEINEQETLATLQVNDLSLLLSGEAKDRLENEIIPAYLNKAPWFNQKRREVYGIQITNSIELPLQEKNSYILLLEVTYTSGLPEMFQLPISFITAQKAKDINDNCPVAVIAQLQVDNYNGLLVDGFYISEVQQYLVQKLAVNEVVITGNNIMEFRSSEKLKEHLAKHQTINARMHEGDQKNTSITFDNCFFLKMYRQVDRTIHTDVEISKYLSDNKFEFVPEYLGTIELKTDKETITLGMLQTMIENHGNGYTYMMERLNNFIERILARDRHALNPKERIGSWKEPVGYDSLPEDLKVFLGGPASDQARLLGIRTAQMHLALANAPLKDFKPEEFSLHYQRSLFSSMQSIVREAFDGLNKKVNTLPDDIKKEAKEILYKKNEILTIFKRIYSKKFDVQKIRIHGNFHLSQVLYTGKDLAIQDFSGNPNRSFSEKRLKRSPLRDVAAMIRSFHYTAHEAFLNNNQVVNEDVQTLMPFAEQWAFYMSGFFIKAYLETVADSSFIPKDKEDLEILLQTFLMEKAVFDLNYEVTYRPNWIIVPLGMIKSILEKHDIHYNQMTATNIM